MHLIGLSGVPSPWSVNIRALCEVRVNVDNSKDVHRKYELSLDHPLSVVYDRETTAVRYGMNSSEKKRGE